MHFVLHLISFLVTFVLDPIQLAINQAIVAEQWRENVRIQITEQLRLSVRTAFCYDLDLTASILRDAIRAIQKQIRRQTVDVPLRPSDQVFGPGGAVSSN